MNPSPSTEAPAAAGTDSPTGRLALAQALLDVALQAQRAGSLHELVGEHPQAARWLVRRYLQRVSGTSGEQEGAAALPLACSQLLRWLVAQLRPDGRVGFEAVPDEAWLQLSSWRPLLAMASHLGFLQVPDFPRQYRRRSGESALDNLCGLWDVGPSTLYRLLERARHSMAATLLDREPDARRLLSLREHVALDAFARQGCTGAAEIAARHLQLAAKAQAAKDPMTELWHRWRASDAAGFARVLLQNAGTLVAAPETDALVQRMAATALGPRDEVDLWLARAALARTGAGAERELQALERARAVAQSAASPLLLGIVHGALGKYYEVRDSDRAFACYQDGAEFMQGAGPDIDDPQTLEHMVTTYARLAWLYVGRNDARSKVVLDRADAIRSQHRVPDPVLGLLEQVWGEYWRRQGDIARSLEHRFRALNIFERLGDRRSVLAAYVNISFDLAARGEHDRAATYLQRVLDAARDGSVEPDVLVGAHQNLGASHFWRADYAAAIASYQTALQLSLAHGLKLRAFRARYNLAEACYTRFREAADPGDEAAGDAHVADALAAPASDSSPAAIDAVRGVKTQILGQGRAAEPNRMLPAEHAVHLAEMSEVQRQREVLAVPADPATHAQAHLAIARAYLAISTQEREAALALIHKHGLQARFTAEFEELKQTLQRELTREQHLADAWKQAAADVVDDARRAPLIAHLVREGRINKSGYAELCGVSPATASKHLGLLAERGLLVQQGKGPSTRYALPA